MTSKDFKQTVKTVSKKFQQYTQAMESDIQLLITSMLDVIETKIVALRKLLKLKLCIKNVKSIASLEYITSMDDASFNLTYTLNEAKDGKKLNDSLEDLSSIVYEIDKNSLPLTEDDQMVKRLKYLEDIADIENLCSALNHHNSSSNQQIENDPSSPLDKYIYMLLEADKQREKDKENEQAKDGEKLKNIGDCYVAHQTTVDPSGSRTIASQENVVYLGKSEYESILDILNMVLRSYKMQDEISKKNKVVEKTKTEPYIGTKANRADERKIASDSTCQQKDVSATEKTRKNRKNNNGL